jgi:hypothetical protein
MTVQSDLARLRKAASDMNVDLWPRNLTHADREALQGLLAMFDAAARLLKRYGALCSSTTQIVAEIEKD